MRDGLLTLPAQRRCHQAAADLLTMYLHTAVFFVATEYRSVKGAPVSLHCYDLPCSCATTYKLRVDKQLQTDKQLQERVCRLAAHNPAKTASPTDPSPANSSSTGQSSSAGQSSSTGQSSSSSTGQSSSAAKTSSSSPTGQSSSSSSPASRPNLWVGGEAWDSPEERFWREQSEAARIAESNRVLCQAQRSYPSGYVWGQLAMWFKQAGNDPSLSLTNERKGCVLLPDVESCYENKRFDLNYTPEERGKWIARLEHCPAQPWLSTHWTFRRSAHVYGTPMMDAVRGQWGNLVVRIERGGEG